jgi:hypothetical protein
MDIKELVAKATNGDDVSADVETLTADELVAYTTELRTASATELAKVTGLRQEAKRVETKNEEKLNAFNEKSRSEQVTLAKDEFFRDSRFNLTTEEKAQFDEEFKKIDSGSIAKEYVLNDLKKAFALVKADDLIEERAKALEYQQNASDYNAMMAGGSSSGGEGGNDDKFSKEARSLYMDWQKAGFKSKTLEEAQKLVDKGTDWKKSSLAD